MPLLGRWKFSLLLTSTIFRHCCVKSIFPCGTLISILISRDIWKIPPIDGFLLLHIKNFEWAINYPECREKSLPSTATRFFEVDVHIVCLAFFALILDVVSQFGVVLTWPLPKLKKSHFQRQVGWGTNLTMWCLRAINAPNVPRPRRSQLNQPPSSFTLPPPPDLVIIPCKPTIHLPLTPCSCTKHHIVLKCCTTSLTWVQCIAVSALLQHVIPGHSRDSLWIGSCLIEMLPRSHRKALSLPETWSLSEFPGHCHVALSLSKVDNSWSETAVLVREAGKYQWHTVCHTQLAINVRDMLENVCLRSSPTNIC